ncbi:MAG: MotA/TolQ/ExbB proton channel family protein [Gammaproteobacteria bacterium]|nr:MotA/TolQ/ExbB proton channel family protein [Gammaproteobacteria bacterium]
MRRQFSAEFIYQLSALIVAAILVQAVYAVTVHPKARAVLAEQAARLTANPNYVPERSFWVLIKDYEQESEIILFLWSMAIIGYKFWNIRGERRLLELDLIPLAEGQSILPEDTREYARGIEALPEPERELLLPRALLAALNRFRMTHNIPDASAEVGQVCDMHSEYLDTELAIVRYIAWAIPAIGFIGTVRGIGGAMTQANKAVRGDISGVIEQLGLAFNSTLIALLLSMVLMFLLYGLQQAQERLVIDARSHSDRKLIQHLQSR